MKQKVLFILPVALVLGLSACATRTAEPRNLSLLKEEIAVYVDSGRYIRQIEKISSEAAVWIEKRAKEYGARNPVTAGSRLAVVFDIDETILSNLLQMRAMDFGYQPAAWDAWVARGEAPAIEPIREVYRRARRAGVEAIFITGRHERDRISTEKNLRAIGVGDAKIFFKPDGSKETAEKFKVGVRARLVAEGYVIVANIGDQESDLAGGYAERTFKLPDPFYFLK